MHKKSCASTAALTLLGFFLIGCGGTTYRDRIVEKEVSPPVGEKKVKNVILLIPDGMGIANSNLGRWAQGGTPLTMDPLASGLIRTYSANCLITDSGAAGTAYATGHKADSETLSVYPQEVTMPLIDGTAPENIQKPLVTLLEAARLAGKGTGLVVMSELNDATPAVFASHASTRDDSEGITEMMVYDGVDVLLGGGSAYLLPESAEGYRTDGEDLTQVLKDNGYDYVTTKDEMNASTNNKVWGLFQADALNADIDRDPAVQPSLAEMTQKAIDTLSKNTNGFFLMVEGSEIDWFAHDGDPVGIYTEVKAFDKAVKAALDFAKADGNTAILVNADHSTGGMYLESYDTSEELNQMLSLPTKTTYSLEGEIDPAMTDTQIREVLVQYGLTDLTDEEVAQVRASLAEDAEVGFSTTVGQLFCDRTDIVFNGWGDHSAEEVASYSYHPRGYRPTDDVAKGVIQNTDVDKFVQEILGLDLETLNGSLYASSDAFTAKGATVVLDNTTDEHNPVVIVTKGDNTLKLPVNKNIADLDGTKSTLDALTMLITDKDDPFNLATAKIWFSNKALDLIP